MGSLLLGSWASLVIKHDAGSEPYSRLRRELEKLFDDLMEYREEGGGGPSGMKGLALKYMMDMFIQRRTWNGVMPFCAILRSRKSRQIKAKGKACKTS